MANFCQMKTTTVFSTPFSSVFKKSAPGIFWRYAQLFFLTFIFAVTPAHAVKEDEAVTILFAELKPAEDSWLLNAAFNVRLNRTQEEALKKGISLHFVTEVELERIRGWWWFNEDVIVASRIGRLNYSLLTRRYQVETVEGYKAYDTLFEALAELGRIENWAIAPKKSLKPGNSYLAAMRMRLDRGQLSKPLQINALASGKWEVEGEWHEWEITP